MLYKKLSDNNILFFIKNELSIETKGDCLRLSEGVAAYVQSRYEKLDKVFTCLNAQDNKEDFFENNEFLKVLKTFFLNLSPFLNEQSEEDEASMLFKNMLRYLHSRNNTESKDDGCFYDVYKRLTINEDPQETLHKIYSFVSLNTTKKNVFVQNNECLTFLKSVLSDLSTSFNEGSKNYNTLKEEDACRLLEKMLGHLFWSNSKQTNHLIYYAIQEGFKLHSRFEGVLLMFNHTLFLP
jgi:hypothetical protein